MKKGLSPLLSVAFLVAGVIVASLIVMNIIMPIVEKGKVHQEYVEAKQVMNKIDTMMQELMFEAPGAKRTMKVSTKNAEFIVSGKEDKLKLRLETKEQLLKPGTRIKEGNMLIVSGPFVNAYESDVDGDGNDDLVLENGHILFAARMFGNETNHVAINTTQMIVMIKNKGLNINITPTTKITIDGEEASSYGTGYSELTTKGYYLSSAGVRFVISTTEISYEAIFTLGPGNDFVELEIKLR